MFILYNFFVNLIFKKLFTENQKEIHFFLQNLTYFILIYFSEQNCKSIPNLNLFFSYIIS